MDLSTMIGLMVSAAVTFLLWLFRPDWLRRKIGIQEPEKLEPYRLSGFDISDLRSDPVIGPSIVDAELKGAIFKFPYSHQLSAKLNEGYVLFRTPKGRACEFYRTDPQGPMTLVMLLRKS